MGEARRPLLYAARVVDRGRSVRTREPIVRRPAAIVRSWLTSICCTLTLHSSGRSTTLGPAMTFPVGWINIRMAGLHG